MAYNEGLPYLCGIVRQPVCIVLSRGGMDGAASDGEQPKHQQQSTEHTLPPLGPSPLPLNETEHELMEAACTTDPEQPSEGQELGEVEQRLGGEGQQGLGVEQQRRGEQRLGGLAEQEQPPREPTQTDHLNKRLLNSFLARLNELNPSGAAPADEGSRDDEFEDLDADDKCGSGLV